MVMVTGSGSATVAVPVWSLSGFAVTRRCPFSKVRLELPCVTASLSCKTLLVSERIGIGHRCETRPPHAVRVILRIPGRASELQLDEIAQQLRRAQAVDARARISAPTRP
jgi:hypothetical protein